VEVQMQESRVKDQEAILALSADAAVKRELEDQQRAVWLSF